MTESFQCANGFVDVRSAMCDSIVTHLLLLSTLSSILVHVNEIQKNSHDW